MRATVLLWALVFILARPALSQRRETGRLQSEVCKEISGVAASALHRGILYVHNDSGDTSRFFAITSSGDLRSTLYFKGNSYYPKGVKDCEDIATGPGPDKSKKYIYLADIGDNLSLRYYVTIYRFEEPATLDKHVEIPAYPIHLKYPDGPRDAEAMLIDPLSRSVYILSKREETVNIYRTSLDFSTGDTLVLAKKGQLHLPGTRPSKWVVSADLSTDGSHLLVKTLGNVLYWRRNSGETLETLLTREPALLPYSPEPQGESICFSSDGKGYFTISEGRSAPIYYYPLP